MPLFIYQAVDQNGRTHTGEIQAADKATAIELIKKLQHLTPISVAPKSGSSRMIEGGLSFALFSRVSPLDKILLTRHLAAVVKAGLSLREALEILWEDSKKPLLKKILFDAKTNLERGQPLSAVFEIYSKQFPPVFIGLVRIGEKSGTLEDSLNNLGEQLMRDYDLVKKVRSAMIYPAILFVASLGVIILLLTFLLPRLVKTFGAANVKLPLITRIFIAISNVLSAQPMLTFAIFLVFIIGGFFIIRSPKWRAAIVGYVQHLPLTRGLIHNLALSRLTRTLNNLLKSGVGVLEALEITGQTVGNQAYQQELIIIREEIRKGSSLAEAFRVRKKLFPRLLVSMITVGERTGTLEKSLGTLSSFYDEEVDRLLKNLVGLLEPALLLVMGLVVGGVALSVLLPIYSLVGAVR